MGVAVALQQLVHPLSFVLQGLDQQLFAVFLRDLSLVIESNRRQPYLN